MGKSDRVKQRTRSGKKRFQGNQFTVNESNKNSSILSASISSVTSVENESVSHSKVVEIEHSTPKQSDKKVSGYRFVDIDILSSIFESLCCPECKTAGIKLHENFNMRKGFAVMFNVSCTCGHIKEFYSSKTCDKAYDINRRMIYTMRTCGQGYAGLEKFTALMDMPKPMTAKNYDKAVKAITKKVKSVAEETLQDAATDFKNNLADNSDGIYDASVSCDGTWQRRGHSSHNGVMTAISVDTGKILDIEAMSRICKECNANEHLKKNNPKQYEEWRARHDCNLNYRGSAPGMELEGAKRIFNRSIDKHNLRYINFYGDGDSKSYIAVIIIIIFGLTSIFHASIGWTGYING